jgi:hypothetical protein
MSAMATDPLYPESSAYHEAGHAVVAAAQGMRLSRHGVHVDADGRGMAFYDFRKPLRISTAPSLVTREQTIIATHAGLIAQQKFHPGCSVLGASDDNCLVDELLKEIEAEGDFIGSEYLRAQLDLPVAAKNLVHNHWSAIEAVAQELWGQPYAKRDEDEPWRGWSDHPLDRRLTGMRVREILEPLGVKAEVWDRQTPRD